MIATIARPVRGLTALENQIFLRMLPKIRHQARVAFRSLHPERQDELVAETIANAYCAFVRLVWRGKIEIAYATPLANYAIRQVISGRQLGRGPSLRDVMSPQARLAHRITLERLDSFDESQGVWREALVEDRSATPADIAASRLDLAAWFHSLPRRNRRIAQCFAMGERPSEVAQRFRISRGRISQIRRLLEASWEAFHEPAHNRLLASKEREVPTVVM